MDGASPARCDFLILAPQQSEVASLRNIAESLPGQYSLTEEAHWLRVPAGDDRSDELTGVVALCGTGRVDSAIAATRFLGQLAPSVVLLVGIAGGFAANGLALGDIIVADRIIDYEHQRLNDAGREFRLRNYYADSSLLASCRSVSSRDWTLTAKPPGLHFGAMFSGDKVIASQRAGNVLLEQEPSALGVEMEGAGVAAAVLAENSDAKFLMIRGVTDLANTSKREDSRAWLHRTCDAVALFSLGAIIENRRNSYSQDCH